MEPIQKTGLGAVGASLAGTLTNARKRNITIREVENGWVIYFDSNGFYSGEKTHIAKNSDEIVGIIDHLLV